MERQKHGGFGHSNVEYHHVNGLISRGNCFLKKTGKPKVSPNVQVSKPLKKCHLEHPTLPPGEEAKKFRSQSYSTYDIITGWWFQPTPLKNDGVKVSWDDEIPN